MRRLLLILALSGGPAAQDDVVREPTPPPDRYDREHDRRLFEMWGRNELAHGPFDEELPAQAPPLRPVTWRVLHADEPAAADFVAEAMRRAAAPASDAETRAASMPADGELAGAYVLAETTLEQDSYEIRFVRAPGAEAVFVNGAGFAGDPEKRGWLGVPVALRTGANRIVAAGIRDGFELELWRPMTRMVMASWAVAVVTEEPRMHDPWDELVVPLFNASCDPAAGVHLHYDHDCNVGERPGMSEGRDGGHAVPLGIVPGLSYLFDVGKAFPSGPEVLAPIASYVYGDAHGERRLLPLRVDQLVPRWPVRHAPRWPPQGVGLLVVECTGDPAFDAELLAVARFTQQRLWERGGVLVPLIPDAELREDPDRWSVHRSPSVVHFGPLHSGDLSGLHARPEQSGRDDGDAVHAIRACSPATLRLAYSIEPLFRSIAEKGQHWTVP